MEFRIGKAKFKVLEEIVVRSKKVACKAKGAQPKMEASGMRKWLVEISVPCQIYSGSPKNSEMTEGKIIKMAEEAGADRAICEMNTVGMLPAPSGKMKKTYTLHVRRPTARVC